MKNTINNTQKLLSVKLYLILLLVIMIIPLHLFAQEKSNPLKLDNSSEYRSAKKLLKKPRNLILAGQISQAIQTYAQLAKRDNTNAALLVEYAYALALSGIYEGALMNLDRARLLGAFSKRECFYAGQVFALMDGDHQATHLLLRSAVPKWVYPRYEELLKKYKSTSSMLQNEDTETMFERANLLASTHMNFQAIALYEQLLEEHPNDYVFHVGYSIPLEKSGFHKFAAEELETGIMLMPNDRQYDGAKQAFSKRLAQLRKTSEKEPPSHKPHNQFNTMLYAGGTFSKDYTSFNARFGVYLSNSFNVALNFGVSGMSNTTNYSVGISGYQRLGNVLVLGLGVSDQIGKDSNVLSIAPSLGFSFINAKGNSSWDIFFNFYHPLQKEVSNTYGVSIGKSFYFGRR